MTSLPLDNISSIGHAEFLVRDIDNELNESQEVYTGNVAVGFANNGGHITRDRFEIFLPVSPHTIRDYGDQRRFQAAPMVSLAGVQAKEDEEFYALVDAFDIGLRSSGSGGST